MVWDTRDWVIIKEIRHTIVVCQVMFTENNQLVTGCCDNKIRIFDTNFNEIETNGEITGTFLASHKDFIAVADINDVKVVDHQYVVLW